MFSMFSFTIFSKLKYYLGTYVVIMIFNLQDFLSEKFYINIDK